MGFCFLRCSEGLPRRSPAAAGRKAGVFSEGFSGVFGLGLRFSSESFLALKLRVIAGSADKVNNYFLLFWSWAETTDSTDDTDGPNEKTECRISDESLPAPKRGAKMKVLTVRITFIPCPLYP